MRCFFALSPPQQVRSEIDALAESLDKQKHGHRYGRRIPAGNYHVTLHFLGEVSETQLDCYRAAADGLSTSGFTLRLDTTGFFRRAHIGWIGSRDCPQYLHELHEQLGVQLAACGYQYEARPYLPHVSLFRRCTRPLKPEQSFLIDWQATDFSLFESVPTRDGVVYRELCNYRL